MGVCGGAARAMGGGPDRDLRLLQKPKLTTTELGSHGMCKLELSADMVDLHTLAHHVKPSTSSANCAFAGTHSSSMEIVKCWR